MNFRRKRRVKGRAAKNYKEWYDETRQYRISWRNQVAGVDVTPAYYACVRCVRFNDDGFRYWGFVGRRGPYRSRKAAIKDCEKHQQLWNKFLAIEGRSKVSQVRELQARALIGTGRSATSFMSDLPLWISQQATPRLLEILTGVERAHSE
jgi:hypothetical protein